VVRPARLGTPLAADVHATATTAPNAESVADGFAERVSHSLIVRELHATE
jgi:molybdopterin biosynthesis enzyme